MKKLWLLFVFISCCMLPLCAAGMSDDGHVDMGQPVLEEYEGDGPDIHAAEPDVTGNQAESFFEEAAAEKAAAKLYTEGILTTGAFVKDIKSVKLEEIDEAFFTKMQSEFLTYVQKVNWETHMRLTPRDSNWLQRICKYVCGGINYIYRLSTSKDADLVANKIGKSIENVSRKRACNRIMCLTIDELVRKIEIENPFILFAMDLATFKEVIRAEPKVAQLYKNMFQFFKARATMEGGDFTENTEELVRLAELGKGSCFETWEELVKFAEHSMELASKGQLNPHTERVAQIRILEVSMLHIEDNLRVKKEVARQLQKRFQKRSDFRVEVGRLQHNIQRLTYEQRARIYVRGRMITPKKAAKWVTKYRIK